MPKLTLTILLSTLLTQSSPQIQTPELKNLDLYQKAEYFLCRDDKKTIQQYPNLYERQNHCLKKSLKYKPSGITDSNTVNV